MDCRQSDGDQKIKTRDFALDGVPAIREHVTAKGQTRPGPPQAAAFRHRATSLRRMILCFAEGGLV
jgi:hypothetical protein